MINMADEGKYPIPALPTESTSVLASIGGGFAISVASMEFDWPGKESTLFYATIVNALCV